MSQFRIFEIVITVVLVLLSLPIATATPKSAARTGEQIRWQVVANGGIRGTSTNFVLTGTAGQTATGSGSSTGFKLNQGFWQNFAPLCMRCGDADGNITINISDIVFLIGFVFNGTPIPGDCNYQYGLGDADGNQTINVSDVVALIGYVFNGTPIPHCFGM